MEALVTRALTQTDVMMHCIRSAYVPKRFVEKKRGKRTFAEPSCSS